jgi:hypothetical protein
MELSILKELVAQITTFDLEGGVNLFSIKPTWIDSKFIPYPVNLKYINKVESTMETTSMKYYFVQQQDYIRIKSIFRLIYLTEKVVDISKRNF